MEEIIMLELREHYSFVHANYPKGPSKLSVGMKKSLERSLERAKGLLEQLILIRGGANDFVRDVILIYRDYVNYRLQELKKY